MTHDEQFIHSLESYFDDFEGSTPLPRAVHDVVLAALPHTKQTGAPQGPGRYLSMIPNQMRTLAVAAAAVVVLIAAALWFRGPNVGAPNESSSPSSAPPGEACSVSNVSAAGSGTLQIVLCATLSGGEMAAIPFTMEAPANWSDSHYSDPNALWLRPPGGGAIAFVVKPAQTVADVVDEISARSGYIVERQESVHLGGADGVVFDLSIEAGAASPQPLFEEVDLDWVLSSASYSRTWVIDRQGTTILIVTGENLAQAVGDALATIAWR